MNLLDGNKLLAEFDRQLKVLRSYEDHDIELQDYSEIVLRRKFMRGIDRAISTIKSGDYTIDKESE